MQAIHVKTIPATATKGLRFKATGLGMCAITSNDYALEGEGNAAAAAQQLLDNYNSLKTSSTKYKISGIGTLPDNTHAVLIAVIVK